MERVGRGGHAVFRASVDRFHRPRAERYVRGEDSAEGYYRDSFDYDLFRRVLIDECLIPGGFFSDEAMDKVVTHAIARFEGRPLMPE